ncbi:hypothetical protein ACQ4PT_046677 [Festuca glaucescens]
MEKSQIQDKEKDLKRDYRMLKDARMQSGFGWDESQFKLQAKPHLWENLEISFGTRIKRFKTKAFPLYESLGQLYEGSIAEGNFNFTSTSAASREDLTQVISDDDEPEGDTDADIAERESEDEHQVMDPAPSAQIAVKIPALDVFKISENREIFLNLVDDKDDKDGTTMAWLRVQTAKLA